MRQPSNYSQGECNHIFKKNNEKCFEINEFSFFCSPEPPEEYKDLPALGSTIVHKTLLEEFIFWTFKYEFPQNVVCFLLNMLPDQDYKVNKLKHILLFIIEYNIIISFIFRNI